MKEIGSKLAVLIIVLVMLFLANLLFDATNESVFGDQQNESEPLLYEETIRHDQLEDNVLPEFGDFEIEESVAPDSLAVIDFGSEPLAAGVRDLLERNYNAIGVNFAGHYSVVAWSCGSDCQSSAIIDTRSGEVIVYGLISRYGLSFSPTSRLLINNIRPETNGTSTNVISTDYYVLTENKALELVAKEVNGEDLLRGCIRATTTARNFLTNEITSYSTPCHVPYGWEIIGN